MTPLFNEGQGEKQRRRREDEGGEDEGYGDGTGSLKQCRRRLMGGRNEKLEGRIREEKKRELGRR